MARVLVTRPASDAARTAESLSALGHETLIDPVIEIEPFAFDTSARGFDALAFTSANAVRIASACENLKSVPVFAVGARSAETARAGGFRNVHAAGGDVVALGELIAAALPSGARVLHLAGEDRAGDLQGLLAGSGISVETRIAYRARPSERLTAETVLAFRQGDIAAVLHYSERSASVFTRLAEAAGLLSDITKTRHLCLSSAVGRPLKSAGLRVEIAASPCEEALLKLLGA